MKHLFPTRQAGLRRYIDQHGQPAMPKAFENGGDFCEGLAPVCVRDKWGYMTEEGEIAIDPRFDNCHEFSEGMGRILVGGTIAFLDDGSKTGFVDRHGNIAIEPAFADAQDFSGGVAAVQTDRNEYWSYIDKTGRIVISRAAITPEDCHDDRIPFEMGGKYGFLDAHGSKTIDPKYGAAYGFREGLAAVAIADRDPSDYGFIDRVGQLVIPHSFRGAMIHFAEGFAAIWEPKGFGFIDHKGTITVKPQFYLAEHFSCGRAAVWPNKKGGHGFIDYHGEMVINPRFEWVKEFRNGLALVRLDGKEGYIDTTGKFIWGPTDEEQW